MSPWAPFSVRKKGRRREADLGVAFSQSRGTVRVDLWGLLGRRFQQTKLWNPANGSSDNTTAAADGDMRGGGLGLRGEERWVKETVRRRRVSQKISYGSLKPAWKRHTTTLENSKSRGLWLPRYHEQCNTWSVWL